MAGAAPTAKPAPFLRGFDIVDRGLLLAESSLSVVIVVVMVLMAVADSVGGVLGLQHPLLQSASDVLMHGTIWAAFLGASFATRSRKHLAIDALGRLLPDRARRVVVAVAATLGAVVALALARGIYEALVDQAHTTNEQVRQFASSGIAGAEIDRSFEFHFVIPAGFLLIALRLLLHGFHEFMAAVRPPPPPTPAERPHPRDSLDPGFSSEAPPAEAALPHELELKCPPVSYAGPVEIGIALAALVALVILTAGTTVMGPIGLAVLVAAVTLVVPLVHRWRTRRELTAPYVPPDAPAPRASIAQIVAGVVGVAVVVGLAWVGIQNIQSIPIGWGVAFFGMMALLGAPLFTFLGGLALFLWTHGSGDVAAMSLPNAVEDVLGPHFARMSVLPTIPIFTLAGYLLSESKTPQRLVRVARAFLGFAPGGLAIVCVVASALFTMFSGASGITIVAIGGLLFPALLRDGYNEKFSLGLVTTGGALGITFFPCLPLIVYGIVAGLQEMPPGHEQFALDKFVLAGILPGLLLVLLLVVYSMVMGVVHKVPRSTFDRGEAWAALKEAKWEVLPVLGVVVGFLLGGPGPAAALTALCVFLTEVFIYKDLSLTRDVPRIIPDSMVLVGAIFVKLCAATVLMAFFVQAQTADRLFEALTCGPPAEAYMAAHPDTIGTCREAVDALARVGQSAGGIIDSPLTFLIALNLFLLIVGMLMDIFSAIVVIVPLIMGIALHFHINPYHLGVVFLMNLEIGYLMPPMGLNLFIAGFRFNRPVPTLYRVVLPFIGCFVVALMVTTYVPGLSLVLVPRGESHASAAASEHEGPAPTATEDAGVAEPIAPAGDCDEQRPDESFEAFDRRCHITGDAPPAPTGGEPGAAPPPTPTPAPAPSGADCEQPRPDESFEDFDRRCHVTGP